MLCILLFIYNNFELHALSLGGSFDIFGLIKDVDKRWSFSLEDVLFSSFDCKIGSFLTWESDGVVFEPDVGLVKVLDTQSGHGKNFHTR